MNYLRNSDYANDIELNESFSCTYLGEMCWRWSSFSSSVNISVQMYQLTFKQRLQLQSVYTKMMIDDLKTKNVKNWCICKTEDYYIYVSDFIAFSAVVSRCDL